MAVNLFICCCVPNCMCISSNKSGIICTQFACSIKCPPLEICLKTNIKLPFTSFGWYPRVLVFQSEIEKLEEIVMKFQCKFQHCILFLDMYVKVQLNAWNFSNNLQTHNICMITLRILHAWQFNVSCFIYDMFLGSVIPEIRFRGKA